MAEDMNEAINSISEYLGFGLAGYELVTGAYALAVEHPMYVLGGTGAAVGGTKVAGVW